MKKVLLLLSSRFEVYEAAVFTDIIGFANSAGIDITLESVGIHKPLDCAYGFQVIPQFLLNDIDLNNYDALAIPGGRSDSGFYEDAFSKNFLDVIKFFNNKAMPIASVCTGALPIGKADVLNGRKGTTYPGKRRLELSEYGVNVQDKDIVIDDNIITSSSPKTGINVALHILSMLSNEQIKIKQISNYFK